MKKNTTRKVKTRSEFMMGNQHARKNPKITRIATKKQMLRGALWTALNCSTNNDEIIEIMDLLGSEYGMLQTEVYFRSKTKGTREQAIEDIKTYL